ncbi:hypothetical protein [Xanthomonas sp. XNM01]|uniref:hypothetical protein n=1 Tax=Xanthomonas sp. XNM01 TaxID=2769289 RepID=UPI00178520B9|nr:hypothetical protein [Xanthomonas sp. XNM01]MBD9369240.1 hypothetical protein [Xanthomonas sp. XNM01]
MNQPAEVPGFFEELEARMRATIPPVQLGIRRDVLLFLSIVLGVVLAIVPWGSLIAPAPSFWLTWAGLTAQLSGATLMAYRQARDVLPEFKDARRKYAVELDESFTERGRLLEWLRSVPDEIRQSRLNYAQMRLETMKSRYPMIFGAVDRLGVLPVLVAVFIQYQALKAVSGPVMFLGVLIVVLYLMSLWMMRFRIQLESYVRVLQDAEPS